MPKTIKPLSDTQIKNAKIREVDYALSDGKGLQLLVKNTGSKVWEFRYTIAGKRKKSGLGIYPTVTLAKAREKAESYRKTIAEKIDPIENKREDKRIKQKEAEDEINTFEKVTEKWLETKKLKITERTIKRTLKTFQAYILPFIGKKPIKQIEKQEYINIILRMRDKGVIYYAHKTKRLLQNLLNYAEEAGLIEIAPTLKLENTLPKFKGTNYPHITDVKEMGKLLRAIDEYNGDISTKYALKLAPFVFVRPTNIRHMEWVEIDFKSAVWKIPAEKMKTKEAHITPLSWQAVEILKEIQKINGCYKYVFISPISTIRALSENTLNMGLMRMGYKGVMVSHGFRHTASTLLHENISKHGFHSEIIERQLAHAERNGVKAAYNHAEYLAERKELLQWWADFLDQLKKS